MQQNEQMATYRHASFAGSAYEVGQKLARFAETHYSDEIHMIFRKEEGDPADREAIRETMALIDRYSPSLNEELRGFAEYFRRSPEELGYYLLSHAKNGGCGHFAVLPSQTADGHLYVGRNYEYDVKEEKDLFTVKADGAYAHTGFGMFLFGRYDGMNEKGLTVTMSNGTPLEWSKADGLKFWIVIRFLLDRCQSVREAVDLVRELPLSSNCNLIVADRSGEAALLEICNEAKGIQVISSGTGRGFVASTNHYTLPEMQAHVKNRMKQSVDRLNAITRLLNTGRAGKPELIQLLASPMPNGLTCHHYEDGLGTLWSILFDVTDLKLQVCFGSPVRNAWYTFEVNEPEGEREFQAWLPNENSTSETWKRI
ncbi:C45 family peptidase [Gorillibacterium sp. CAU 1737]|uniref:C45 family peptidase n=1 Tax=Gorillibacterium sp. CAU 1737 TaxID=3140362 RepID=UPI003260727E